jgi:hypothetical protein
VPTTLFAVFAVVFAAFAAAMLLMAVGVLARRPCLKGSCGGMGHADDGPGCAGCPNRRREA